MKKFVAGKSSILALTAVFAICAFLLGTKVTSVSADAPACTGGNRDNGCSCSNDNNCASNKCSSSICVAQSTATPIATATPTAAPSCANGTAQSGSECNVHASDCSHVCAPGLSCIPQNDNSEGNGKCGTAATATPTATPICNSDHPCATSTPTPVATSTPAPTDNNSNNNGGGDDGLGCATHDCSGNHVASPQGQVLGASTMAGTGSFDEMVYQAIMTVGATLSAFGIKGLKKSKKVSKK